MHRYCAANNALRYMQYKALQWRHARAPFFRGFGLAILQVNNAPQFLQLKKMMATKNEEIKSLRVRLNK